MLTHSAGNTISNQVGFVVTARKRDSSIVFSIDTKFSFLSLNTITHEPPHDTRGQYLALSKGPFELKTGTPVTPATGSVHSSFGFNIHISETEISD